MSCTKPGKEQERNLAVRKNEARYYRCTRAGRASVQGVASAEVSSGRGRPAGIVRDLALPMRHLHPQEPLITSCVSAPSKPRRVVRPPARIWEPVWPGS
jgi:hypothetical protein